MLKELKTLFAQQAEHDLLYTTRDFHSCRQEEGRSVSSYVLKMKGYIDNLERLGHPVTLGLGTVNDLHAMLKLHEQTLPKSNAPTLNAIRAGKGKNKQAYAPTPKIPPPPKRENPTKDSIFHECGEIGHWKRNCPQYLAKLMNKKKNTAFGAGGSGIFIIELNTILNRSWIYNTGCGTHICNTTQGLRASRKLKSGALSLYVGNGQCKAVKAIDAFNLCLPSGLEIVLKICHYAPSITRGVISVSRLYEDGFVNCFVDNTIQVFRNNVVYFSAILRDGDFSRYGYVYLLKHEHKVFETFKVFQKEVENQLGKTIKSLRFDCGGEYTSQEFLDHLKDYGIIAHLTPPYTPQHNGVSERGNRTLLDM
nr:hypothetical protein [Tanacetum cinerariifolium]